MGEAILGPERHLYTEAHAQAMLCIGLAEGGRGRGQAVPTSRAGLGVGGREASPPGPRRPGLPC